MPSVQTCGKSPPTPPATEKTIMPSHSHQSPRASLLPVSAWADTAPPATANAMSSNRPARMSACRITVAYGWPDTSRLLKNSSGDRSKPGLSGTIAHQL